MANSKKIARLILVLGIVIFILGAIATVGAFADTGTPADQTQITADGDNITGIKALASAIAIGVPASAGAIGMGIFGAKTVEGISRQPEADGKIRTSFMLGLVFIETVVIYALLVVILIIFVL